MDNFLSGYECKLLLELKYLMKKTLEILESFFQLNKSPLSQSPTPELRTMDSLTPLSSLPVAGHPLSKQGTTTSSFSLKFCSPTRPAHSYSNLKQISPAYWNIDNVTVNFNINLHLLQYLFKQVGYKLEEETVSGILYLFHSDWKVC